MHTLAVLTALILTFPALAEVGSGPNIEHENCTLTVPSYSKMTENLKAKGFGPATYTWKYQVNGRGPVLEAQRVADNSELISRGEGVDGGAAELGATLKALRYSGIPEFRLFDSSGKPIPVKTHTTHSHIGAFIDYEFDVKDNETIQAALVVALEKAKVKSTDKYWYKLEYKPVHESTVVKSPKFTLRSLAQEALAKFQKEKMEPRERAALEIIAGRNVSLKERNSVDAEALNTMRFLLITQKLQGNLSEDELTRKSEAAFPVCKVKKKTKSGSDDSEEKPDNKASPAS